MKIPAIVGLSRLRVLVRDSPRAGARACLRAASIAQSAGRSARAAGTLVLELRRPAASTRSPRSTATDAGTGPQVTAIAARRRAAAKLAQRSPVVAMTSEDPAHELCVARRRRQPRRRDHRRDLSRAPAGAPPQHDADLLRA